MQLVGHGNEIAQLPQFHSRSLSPRLRRHSRSTAYQYSGKRRGRCIARRVTWEARANGGSREIAMTLALFMLECGGGATGRRQGHPTGDPPVNAISHALTADLDVVISVVADDPAVRSLPSTAAKRVFAPGADVSDVYRRQPDRDRPHGLALERAFDRLVRLPKVVPARSDRARPSSPASADNRQRPARRRKGLQHTKLGTYGSTNAGESLHRRDSSSFEKLA
jgi:hypothetical protein